MTELTIRLANEGDAGPSARIFYDAYEVIGARHNFPIEPGSREFTDFLVGSMLATEGICGLTALRDGEVVGSAFADERGPIVGIGPVTVDPHVQDGGVGRALMQALLDREHERGAPGVRLVQTAYHNRSLSLYAKLGFWVREPLSVFQGSVPRGSVTSRRVRPAALTDLADCNAVCRHVHGHDRSEELAAWIRAGSARVAEAGDRITGYATGFGYGWHAVGQSNEDIVAMLESAESFEGLGILLPSRNAVLVGWALHSGLQLIQQSTLMTTGLYNEPQGAWLPSIVY